MKQDSSFHSNQVGKGCWWEVGRGEAEQCEGEETGAFPDRGEMLLQAKVRRVFFHE